MIGSQAEGDRDYNWLESEELLPMENSTFNPNIAVKKYPKSSADRQDLEIDIRPEPVLRFTMLHLCKTIGNVLQSQDPAYLKHQPTAEDDWYAPLPPPPFFFFCPTIVRRDPTCYVMRWLVFTGVFRHSITDGIAWHCMPDIPALGTATWKTGCVASRKTFA